MNNDIFSFYDLVDKYEVKVPILQRDYAQGREKNVAICENFLKALKKSIIYDEPINLDFIYGNLNDNVFLPLDGQQRLTTLFLLHWYSCEKENIGHNNRDVLKNFSYETRLSSRRFCEALLNNSVPIDNLTDSISGIILDSKWFFMSWKHDSTIRAMLRTIDIIHSVFKDVDNIWDALVSKKNVGFHLLILENFGLSDDLYIKMNARGRLLTPFENLKAEIQDKSLIEGWETQQPDTEKFSCKIDNKWTDFLWKYFNKNNSVDNTHMNLITTLVMVKLSTGQLLKGVERTDTIRKLNENNSARELVNYINRETFDYICVSYDLYSDLLSWENLPVLNMDMWRHKPETNLLHEILLGSNTSYTHKILFYAQTEYLFRNEMFVQEKFEEWMRVVRNILSRADITPDGKRNDVVRSPEAFYGAINLINELASGSTDIYSYLCYSTVQSSFAREQVREEILKANIIQNTPEHKKLIHKTEDNEILRGKIMFALECAGYKQRIDEIDFDLLLKVQQVFETYFNRELDNTYLEFDKFRRAMLTIEVSEKYQYYNYWWSYWYAAESEKRKLFPLFREIEYFIGLDEFKVYFIKLIIQLTVKNYDEIITDFAKPDNMENWQYRLIKEERLLFDCSSKYIAIAPDRTYCYLMKGKRPSDLAGSKRVE